MWRRCVLRVLSRVLHVLVHLVKGEMTSDCFASFCRFLRRHDSLHFVLKISSAFIEMANVKEMNNCVICRLEAFLQSSSSAQWFETILALVYRALSAVSSLFLVNSAV